MSLFKFTNDPGTIKAPRNVSQAYAELKAKQNTVKEYSKIRDSYAVAYVAISIVMLAYSGLFSTLPILLLYLIWIPQVFIKGLPILRVSKEIALPASFAGLCLVSILWSDYPESSLRAGLEVTSMIVCAVIMARTVHISPFIKGLMLGITVVLMIMQVCLSYLGLDLFGSKNQVGFIAEIGLYASIIYLCTNRFNILRFLLSGIALAVCGVSLVLSHSATSTASFAAALIMSYVAYLLVKFPMRYRVPLLAAAVIAIGIFALAVSYFNLYGAGLSILGRDETLTGRTYLWSEGLKVGMEKPFIGHGYYAFWIPGQPQAEKYWYESHERSGAGFHFHNLFIQAFVDLGIVGAAIIALSILSSCVRSLHYLIRNGNSLTSIFAFGISIMFLIRSFTEVDIMGPFGVGLLVFYSILPRLTAPGGPANGGAAFPRQRHGPKRSSPQLLNRPRTP